MFYIYMDGKLINQPLEDLLITLSPRVVLEMGKAGSLEFSLPPNNIYYNNLRKLKTLVTVELDESEIFRGRVLSHDRNFNNVKKVYVEGDLAYLVDSAQKPDKYTGKTHDLFRKIVEAHNAQMDAEKQFTVGTIGIENRDIVITGQSEEIKDPDTGTFDYKQIAINSTTGNWPTTYDYIQSCIIDYCGGYLRTRHADDTVYLDLLIDYGTEAVQEIEFGTNMLDLTEAATAEEVFTVLIPIGDDNLTIASVNGGSNELVDNDAVELYGRIVKTYVFDNVNQASTLLENAKRFMENHENVPITFTIKAVDLHLVDASVEQIRIGDSVNVRSSPHGVTGRFTCTRIEYDLENPTNNTYTFGNPKQTLTQRYREDRRKTESNASGSGGAGGAGGSSGAASGAGGAGGVGSALEDLAKENLDKFFDAWINVDPETAHIDMGAIYKELKDGKDILKNEVGIDLDAPTGHVNIYSLREHLDEVEGKVTNNSAAIDLWATDMKSQIDAHVGWSEELDGKVTAWHAQLILETNKNGEAIAALKTTHENRMANLELKSTALEASALMKATYNENRTADLELISNNYKSIASLSASHNGRLASIEAWATEFRSAVVMKAEFESRTASIEATVSSQGSKIKLNADAIETKASTYTLNAKIATINADIVDLSNTIETKVNSLTANKIEALKADVSWLQAKVLRVSGLTADNLYATNYVSAPAIRMGGRTVATESYVDDKVANLVTSSWVSAQDFATRSYVDSRNSWGSVAETGKRWCQVGGTSVLVALGNHTHSTYCTESRVRELIAAATISWYNISNKPSTFPTGSHRHYFSFSQSIANGHTHRVTVGGSTVTTQGVSTNATHSIGFSGYTGYN